MRVVTQGRLRNLVGVLAAALVLSLAAGTAFATKGSSGDTSSPQPPSNADFSGNGANVHGAYDSTRDGSASLNGDGGGAAVGKPCAGCVGSADNKNPQGQAPQTVAGLDANAGYECDRNQGIGQSNPAHTSCQASTSETVETPTTQPVGNTTTTTVPATVSHKVTKEQPPSSQGSSSVATTTPAAASVTTAPPSPTTTTTSGGTTTTVATTSPTSPSTPASPGTQPTAAPSSVVQAQPASLSTPAAPAVLGTEVQPGPAPSQTPSQTGTAAVQQPATLPRTGSNTAVDVIVSLLLVLTGLGLLAAARKRIRTA